MGSLADFASATHTSPSLSIALSLNMARFALLAVSLLAAFSQGRRQVDPTAYVPRYMQEVDFYNHDSYIQQRGFNWVFFGATWCPHTQEAIPIFDQVANTLKRSHGYDISYFYAYVDKPRSWDYWNNKKGLRTIYNVTVYPNIRMYYDGDYMHRYKGARNMAKFQRYLNKVIPIIVDHINSPNYNPDDKKRK